MITVCCLISVAKNSYFAEQNNGVIVNLLRFDSMYDKVNLLSLNFNWFGRQASMLYFASSNENKELYL
jgi:hypothetical protein